MQIFVFAAIVLFLLNVLYALIYWWRGRRGLDQYPNPHGRYYDEWLSSKDVGDYYPWLREKKREMRKDI